MMCTNRLSNLHFFTSLFFLTTSTCNVNQNMFPCNKLISALTITNCFLFVFFSKRIKMLAVSSQDELNACSGCFLLMCFTTCYCETSILFCTTRSEQCFFFFLMQFQVIPQLYHFLSFLAMLLSLADRLPRSPQQIGVTCQN